MKTSWIEPLCLLLVLGILIFLLGAKATPTPVTGRYQIFGNSQGVWIIDTQTSELYCRIGAGWKIVYLGTIKNPVFRVVDVSGKGPDRHWTIEEPAL